MSNAGLQPTLERFRRRAGLTAGVSIALGAASATAVIAEAIRWSWFARGPGLSSTVVPVALTAGVGAMIVAWLRRPPLRDVARTIDARLSLQAAVVTAFQCRDEHDAFAVRTVIRATQALSTFRPADVYPWRLSRAAAGLIASSAIVGLALLIAPTPASDADRVPGRMALSSPGGAPGQGASSSTRPATSPSAGVPPEARPATASPSGTEARPAVEATAPRTTPPRAAQAPGDGSETPRHVSTPPVQSQATARRDGTEAPRPSGAEGGGSGSLTSRDAPGQPGTGATAPGGGRRGTGTGSAAANRATGEAGALGDASATGQPSAADEQALALDRVPMHRRTYVQRYLESLRSAEPR